MELKQIRSIIDLMTRNDLAEFELEKEDFKIRIVKSGGNAPASTMVTAAPAPVAAPSPAAAENAVTEAPEGTLIHSPMVGTFYRAPSPESPPFVDVGSAVEPESVVCIIEAMKVMNEIKAELKGKVIEVLAENGKPVEFGQPLFRVQSP